MGHLVEAVIRLARERKPEVLAQMEESVRPMTVRVWLEESQTVRVWSNADKFMPSLLDLLLSMPIVVAVGLNGEEQIPPGRLKARRNSWGPKVRLASDYPFDLAADEIKYEDKTYSVVRVSFAPEPSAPARQRPAFKDDVEKSFKAWLATYLAEKGHMPTRDETDKWAVDGHHNRDRVRKLRKLHPHPRLHQRGPRGT